MLGADTEVEIVESEPGENLYQVTTPSGGTVWLTPEEETEAVKDALQDGLAYKINRKMEVEKAVISSVGTAMGLAIGGFFVGLLIDRKRR